MTRIIRCSTLVLLAASAASAQNPTPQTPNTAQVPKGQMPALGRPTEGSDVVPTLDFDEYFLGKWTFEWTTPDSPIGPGGDVTGTTIVTKLDGRFYEAVTQGQGPKGPFKARELWAYHRENKTVARYVTDSRGFNYLQFGPIGGDLGGIYNVHFDSAPFTANGKSVRFRSIIRLLSPLNYRVAMSLSVDGGPYTNLGHPWWRKDLSYVGK
ncbi:MAG: DUF1579 family protein [Vicinamibacterales bacterium]